eukprot:5303592-Pleurochrysis_carterae.AAC.1
MRHSHRSDPALGPEERQRLWSEARGGGRCRRGGDGACVGLRRKVTLLLCDAWFAMRGWQGSVHC